MTDTSGAKLRRYWDAFGVLTWEGWAFYPAPEDIPGYQRARAVPFTRQTLEDYGVYLPWLVNQ